jgi:hypothetical protein
MIRPLLCLLMFAAAPPVGAAPAQSPAPAAPQRACAAIPKLALPPGFQDPRRAFAPAGRNMRALETRFASAYRLACRRPVRAPLPAGPLFLKNAPDANTTSIYRDGEEGEGSASAPTVIEHPFIGHGGRVDIPSVEEIRSALVCSVYNLDPPAEPADAILECLVD